MSSPAGPSHRRLRVATRTNQHERRSHAFLEQEEALYSTLLRNLNLEGPRGSTSTRDKGKGKGREREVRSTDTDLALLLAREEAEAAARFDIDRSLAVALARHEIPNTARRLRREKSVR